MYQRKLKFLEICRKTSRVKKNMVCGWKLDFLRKMLKENLKIKGFIQKKGHEHTSYIVRHFI